METLLLKALKGNEVEKEINKLVIDFSGGIDPFLLTSQLLTFKLLISKDSSECFHDILDELQTLTAQQTAMISEVRNIVKLLMVSLATTASGERSFSSARRLKTWLRSTMNQERFNSVAVLHAHKRITERVDIVSLANEFVAKNDNRKRNFGKFSTKDL